MLKKIGIACIVLSFVLYGLIFAVPFLSVGTTVKAGIVTGLIIAGEITFWGGGLLLGREVVKKYRRYLQPQYWLSKKDKTHKGEREEGI